MNMAAPTISMWMEKEKKQWPEKWGISSPKFLEILVLYSILEIGWLSIRC